MADLLFYGLATTRSCGGAPIGVQSDRTGPAATLTTQWNSSASNAYPVSTVGDGKGVVFLEDGVAGESWSALSRDTTVEVMDTNMNLTITAVEIWSYNTSTCAFVTKIGELTGLSQSCASANSANHSIPWGAGSLGANEVLTMRVRANNGAMSVQTAGLKFTIATPIEEAAGESHEATVTDSNPAQTDSATAIWSPAPTEAAVTDSNPSQSDSATATHTAPAHSAAVTDSNPAQSDSATATHAAPVTEAAVTDSNPAQVDSAEASFVTQLHEATVTDSNPAQTDASEASYAAPVFEAAVTDSNPPQSDSAAVQQLIDEVTASITDSNPAQTDVASLTFAGPAEIDDLQAVAVSSSQINLSWTGVL